jgi:hypothetical protein
MDVEIERTAEALDQRDRTRVCALPGVTGFMNQVRCNGGIGQINALLSENQLLFPSQS